MDKYLPFQIYRFVRPTFSRLHNTISPIRGTLALHAHSTWNFPIISHHSLRIDIKNQSEATSAASRAAIGLVQDKCVCRLLISNVLTFNWTELTSLELYEAMRRWEKKPSNRKSISYLGYNIVSHAYGSGGHL